MHKIILAPTNSYRPFKSVIPTVIAISVAVNTSPPKH